MSTPLPDPVPRRAQTAPSAAPHGGRPGPSDVGVRAARVQDAAEVGRVQAAVWRDAFAADLPAVALELCTPDAFADAWRRSLEDAPADHILLVAHESGTIVGLLALGPSTDPDLGSTGDVSDGGDELGAAEILVMGVHPDHRRAGHGSRLLAAAVDLARDGRVTAVTVWVPARHEATRSFLQGAGFAPDRARRERIVDADGRTVIEARLTAAVEPADPATPDAAAVRG